MSDPTLYCYDYVNQPYPRVREALLADPLTVFQRATAAATHAATLHVRLGAIDIGTDVAIRIVSVADDRMYDRPATRLVLEWQAVTNPRMFPAMNATLAIFSLSPTETQLELRGHYHPPMGKLGEVIDAAAGHRLAEASVNHFIQEVAGWLRSELATSPPAPDSEAKLPRDVVAPPVPLPIEPAAQPGAPVDLEC